MIDVQKCLETMREIKRECSKHPTCTECPFYYDNIDSQCSIETADAPCIWEVKENKESEEK